MSKKEEKQKENNPKEEIKSTDKEIVEEKKIKKEGLESKNKSKEAKELEKEIEVLKRDKLSLLAELDNKQKQFRRQIEEIYKYSNRKFVLAVLDFLVDLEERALKAMRDDSDKKVQNHLVGVEMMRNNLWKILESEGVKEIEIKIGETVWSSEKHELIAEVENDEFPERKVIKVVEKGYLFHDQVLRPAKVEISKKNK